MAVGSLAYDTVPLSSLGKLDPFSPEFQSLATDKGAAILHMLRYVMGDEKFDNTMRGFVLKYSLKSAGEEDFRKEAEEHQGSSLVWFFSQWLDSTGRAGISRPSTPFTALAPTRGSARSVRSRRTWTYSACR